MCVCVAIEFDIKLYHHLLYSYFLANIMASVIHNTIAVPVHMAVLADDSAGGDGMVGMRVGAKVGESLTTMKLQGGI